MDHAVSDTNSSLGIPNPVQRRISVRREIGASIHYKFVGELRVETVARRYLRGTATTACDAHEISCRYNRPRVWSTNA